MATRHEVIKFTQQLIDMCGDNGIPLDNKILAIAADVCGENMATALWLRTGIPTKISRFVPSGQITLMDRDEFKRTIKAADLQSPKWDERHSGPHWTRYVGERVQAIWDTFTDEQRKAIADDSYDFDSADSRWDE